MLREVKTPDPEKKLNVDSVMKFSLYQGYISCRILWWDSRWEKMKNEDLGGKKGENCLKNGLKAIKLHLLSI